MHWEYFQHQNRFIVKVPSIVYSCLVQWFGTAGCHENICKGSMISFECKGSTTNLNTFTWNCSSFLSGKVHNALKMEKIVPSQFNFVFLIWMSHSFKKGASYDNTISHFDQSFRLSCLWLILVRDLGRSGQNKSWRTEKQNKWFFFWNFERFVLMSGCIITSVEV